MLTTPFTFGSRMKLRPVISATALTTASMSALTKLRVTMSSAAWPTGAASAAARDNMARNRGIDVVKGWGGSRTLDAAVLLGCGLTASAVAAADDKAKAVVETPSKADAGQAATDTPPTSEAATGASEE